LRVTIKEIARELGVSHSTVSRVLNDKHSTLVSEATRVRITQAAKRLGYRPSRIAQALKGEHTQLIGVFLPDGNDYFFQDVLANLCRIVEGSGFELLPFASSGEKIADKWLRLLRWDLDGVFVFDYMFYTEALQEALSEHSGYIPPMVGLFNSKSRLRDYVAIDFTDAMNALLTGFLVQGRKRIGYLARHSSFHPEEERFAIYTQFVRSHGLEPHHIALPDGLNLCVAARQTLLDHIDAGHPLPDALFCQNDEMALGAYRALYERGVSVPDTLALAGCDGIPYAQYLEKPLTTISLPVEEACRQGWEILQRRMSAPDSPPAQILLQAVLLQRASSAGEPRLA
jgi:LacI family transcriptional regulator